MFESLGSRPHALLVFFLFACGARSELEDGPSGNEPGYGGGTEKSPLQRCLMKGAWVPVALGSNHSCTVRIGRVYCWGSNELGQVGNGSDQDALEATPIDVPCDVDWLAAGLNHTCAIARTGPDGGDVYCWGANESMQSAAPADIAVQAVPRRVELPLGALALRLVVGARHTCADTSQGVYCWGSNDRGQLGPWGPGNFGPRKIPDEYPQPTNGITAGGDTTCVVGLTASSCWGDDSRGQHGDGSADDEVGPTIVDAQISYPWQGSSYGLAFSAGIDNTLIGWGDGSSGVLGSGVTGVSAEPQALTFVNITSGMTIPALGGAHVCALYDSGGPDGRLVCWGANDHGQLGIGSKEGSTTPMFVTLDAGIAASTLSVGAGRAHTCAHEAIYSATDTPHLPKVYCWGANDHGQLGDGTREERLSPARVVGIPIDPGWP